MRCLRDGVVAKKLYSLGETITRLEPVVEVIQLDPLWIEFDCPLDQEWRVQPGAEVLVSPAAIDAEPRRAVVIHTAMQADPSSHTVRVRLSLPNAKDPWRAGLKMRIAVMPNESGERPK